MKVTTGDKKWDEPDKRFLCRKGRKVFGAFGIVRGASSRKGTPKADVECLVMTDLEPPDAELNPPSDEGLTCRGTIWVTEGGIKHGLVPLLRAVNWPPDKEIDVEDFGDDHDALLEPVTSGYFIAEVEHSVSNPDENGKTRTYANINFDSAVPYTGEVGPDWGERCNEALDDWIARREEWARNNQRDSAGNYKPRDGDPY